METNMLSSCCCPKDSWGPIAGDYGKNAIPDGCLGKSLTLGDTHLPCYYVTPFPEHEPSSAAAAVVIFLDIYGPSHRFIEIADRLARQGYHVVIPDCFRGKTIRDLIPSEEEEKSLTPESRGAKIKTFISQFPIESIIPDVKTVVEFLVEEKKVDPNQIGGYGFCWGAWVVAKIASMSGSKSLALLDGNRMKNNYYDCSLRWKCAVCPHPSHTKAERNVFGRDEVAMCHNIKIPLLLLVGKNDDERLHPPDETNNSGSNNHNRSDLVTVLREHGGDSVLFENMLHGWVSRGDRSQPEVRVQIELALRLSEKFFRDHLLPINNET